MILLILLLINNVLNGGLNDPRTYFLNMLLSLPGILIGLSFHEFAHAWTSHRLGDPTPMLQGRVTLDPRAHLDLFGFACLVFCGFGWGVPVEIDNRRYRHPRRDELIVSSAGVTMNLLLAVVFAFTIKGFRQIVPNALLTYDNLPGLVLYILFHAILINLTLAVFNLLPVPPLDGFGILTQIFDLRKQRFYPTLAQSGPMILMLLLLTGTISKILMPAVNSLYRLLMNYIIL